jgi:hypothetical protein
LLILICALTLFTMRNCVGAEVDRKLILYMLRYPIGNIHANSNPS